MGVGSSGMATVPSSGNYIVFGTGGMGGMGGGFPGQQGGFPGMPGQQSQQTAGGVSISAGDTVEIKDSDGSTVYSFTATKAASHIVYASDTLTEGGSYTLYVNGTEVSTAAVTAGNGTQGGNTPPAPPSGEEGGDTPPAPPSGRLTGDVNGDGSVTLADVVLLKQHLAGWNVTIVPENSDINGDGSVTVADVVLLKQYLAGWKVQI